jgi:hypothetical protein
MNELASMLIEGLKILEGMTRSTVNFRGKWYPCVGGAELRSKKVDMGGMQFYSDCPIVIRLAVLGDVAPPAQKQTLVFSSGPDAEALRWRVDQVRTLWGEIVILDCNDPSQ